MRSHFYFILWGTSSWILSRSPPALSLCWSTNRPTGRTLVERCYEALKLSTVVLLTRGSGYLKLKHHERCALCWWRSLWLDGWPLYLVERAVVKRLNKHYVVIRMLFFSGKTSLRECSNSCHFIKKLISHCCGVGISSWVGLSNFVVKYQ